MAVLTNSVRLAPLMLTFQTRTVAFGWRTVANPLSFRTKKIMWKGENGAFAKRDLVFWFKVYNQTQLDKVKPILKKEKKDNQA